MSTPEQIQHINAQIALVQVSITHNQNIAEISNRVADTGKTLLAGLLQVRENLIAQSTKNPAAGPVADAVNTITAATEGTIK